MLKSNGLLVLRAMAVASALYMERVKTATAKEVANLNENNPQHLQRLTEIASNNALLSTCSSFLDDASRVQAKLETLTKLYAGSPEMKSKMKDFSLSLMEAIQSAYAVIKHSKQEERDKVRGVKSA